MGFRQFQIKIVAHDHPNDEGRWLERVVPTPWLTLVAYALVIIGAVLITELARRSPLSLPLTGRRFARRRHRVAQLEVPPG